MAGSSCIWWLVRRTEALRARNTTVTYSLLSPSSLGFDTASAVAHAYSTGARPIRRTAD